MKKPANISVSPEQYAKNMYAYNTKAKSFGKGYGGEPKTKKVVKKVAKKAVAKKAVKKVVKKFQPKKFENTKKKVFIVM